MKKTGKKLHHHFHFSDPDEFVIFLLWGLFVSVFLLSFAR